MTTKKTAVRQKSAQKAAKPSAKAKAPVKPKKAHKPVLASQKTIDEPKLYTMPREVSDWIERANVIMTHQSQKILRLEEENTKLKSWRKWAEHRILRSDHE
jgi:hypothetical protein